MTYRYVLKWRKAPGEYISVEAWPRDRSLTTPEERGKPSFTIGKLEGTRNIMLWMMVEDLAGRFGSRKRGRLTRVELPPDDIGAVAKAYRVGLAAAALATIESEEAAENALRYITRATQEEIWFWASKFLGVVDEGIKRERVIEALSIISTAT
uniref:Uncharacterized protein n=1 Tax=viral metagenome TaxID=1070528 RepID=A0A6M3M5D1_9ZZZZ